MKKIKLKEDVYAYEFTELKPYKTYVYIIQRASTIYIIDTFCGPYYMDQIKSEYPFHTYIVINTHYHFDHIWGNSSFKNDQIYAHQSCKDMIKKHGKTDLMKYQKEAKGVAELTLPNHCFHGQQYALDHDLYLYYTPGHSIDSISLYDALHQIYFVGDALEKPLVQLEMHLLSSYHKTLEHYLHASANVFYAGHTLTLTKRDVYETLQYIVALQGGKEIHFTDPYIQKLHEQNIHQ